MTSISSSDFLASDAAAGQEGLERTKPKRQADPVMTIGELAREAGVTLRALRFYQSKGLLSPARNGTARMFSQADREHLALILQGKRLRFTLSEIRGMVGARDRGCARNLPISRKKCIEQIKLLEHERRDIDLALAELRQIYSGMYMATDIALSSGVPAAKTPCNQASPGKSS
jgi:DNA-binding transcriptional MerR regulator